MGLLLKLIGYMAADVFVAAVWQACIQNIATNTDERVKTP